MAVARIDVNTVMQTLIMRDKSYKCAIGRSGALSEATKREGDGATPMGIFPIRYLYWRPDRLAKPDTALDTFALSPRNGWCDDPADANYNRPVILPYSASLEKLWRDDHLYDLILVMGHNDDPPIKEMGSAIFVHIAQPDYTPTEGCIALTQGDLLNVLQQVDPGTYIHIR